jgi:hypothetical protein
LEEDKKKKGRKIRLLFFIVFILALGFLVGFVIYRAGLRNRLDTFMDEAKSIGRPVSLKELDAWYDNLSKGSDTAEMYQKAFKLYNKVGVNDEKLIFAGTASLPALKQEIPKEIIEMSEKYLNDNKKAVELLKKTSKCGAGRFNVDLGKVYYPYSIDFNHLVQLLEGVRLFSIESILLTEKGEGAKSAEVIIDILNMSTALDNEPASFAFTAQADCQEQGIICLEWLLSKIKLSDGVLKKLSEKLKSIERSKSAPKALVGDLCFFTTAYKPALRLPEPVWSLMKIAGLGFKERIFIYEKTALLESEWKKSVIDSLVMNKKINSEAKDLPYYYRLSKEAIPQIGGMFVYNAERVALIRLARTVIAVQRYCLKYKKLPGKLQELVPEFLDSVPLDPFSTKPLKYLDFGDKYIVYSIGEDETDNEGQMKNKFISGLKEEGDIVFSVVR